MAKTITISTLILSLCVPIFAPFSAVYATEDTQTTWSANEMAVLKEQIDASDELVCHEDRECRDELYFGRLDGDEDIYLALDYYNTSDFIITAINPSQETIRLFFQDEDWMLKRMGIEEERGITEAYLFWLEDGMIGPDKGTYEIYLYSEDVKNNLEKNGLHPVLSKSTTNDGTWLPARTELEFSIAGSEIALNREGIIYFTAEFGGTVIGLKNYSECINSPDYQEGMECSLKFTASGTRYIPTTPESHESPTVKADDEDVMADSQGYGEVSETTIDTDMVISSIPKSPNTGTATIENDTINKSPVWLVLVLIISSIPLIWLFGPKIVKKSPKKSKKSIDKDTQSR